MNRTELDILESAEQITWHVGRILHNCEYCEDQGIDVTETRKAVQWIVTGAVRDLEKMNARLNRELDLWSHND